MYEGEEVDLTQIPLVIEKEKTNIEWTCDEEINKILGIPSSSMSQNSFESYSDTDSNTSDGRICKPKGAHIPLSSTSKAFTQMSIKSPAIPCVDQTEKTCPGKEKEIGKTTQHDKNTLRK